MDLLDLAQQSQQLGGAAIVLGVASQRHPATAIPGRALAAAGAFEVLVGTTLEASVYTYLINSDVRNLPMRGIVGGAVSMFAPEPMAPMIETTVQGIVERAQADRGVSLDRCP